MAFTGRAAPISGCGVRTGAHSLSFLPTLARAPKCFRAAVCVARNELRQANRVDQLLERSLVVGKIALGRRQN
jgi:hypothetical protein